MSKFYRAKGTKKYRCEECQAESFHHWIELNRAARLRCPACGSARMEMVAREAKEDAASLQQVRVEGHRDMTLPSDTHNSKRKVT